MDQVRIEQEVDAIFAEVLGYVPGDGEDLAATMTSLVRLEFLIEAEERLSLSLLENDLAPDEWWGSRSSILELMRAIIDRPSAPKAERNSHG